MHEFFLTVLCFTLKKIYGTIDFPVVKDINKNGARSIQPKFPEILVQNSMDRFGPTGKVSKKLVHLLRWTTSPGRTGLNFGWMDRAHEFNTKYTCLLLMTEILGTGTPTWKGREYESKFWIDPQRRPIWAWLTLWLWDDQAQEPIWWAPAKHQLDFKRIVLAQFLA